METPAEQGKSTISTPLSGGKIAYLNACVAEQAPPQVYNSPDRAVLGRQPLAAAKAPKLANPLEVLNCSWATVRTEDGFAIVGPTGACFAQAASMTALLPWVIAYAQRLDGLVQ